MSTRIQLMNARIRVGLAVLLLVASAAAQRVTGVDTVGFTVADMERSVEFFSKVLDFKKMSDTQDDASSTTRPAGKTRVVQMNLGDERIELTQYLVAPGRAFPPGTRGNDRWFQHIAIITRDMNQAYARLRSAHVRHASNAPQTLPEWNKNAANIKAFYFRDPDGHFLEILQFPPDKGLAKWHRDVDDLFMGIDHTAVVVADTDASLRYYRDQLGMKVAGESDNYGVEQEHLNGVFNAHLRITALRADHGPGIELLEYLSPLDGRPFPADARGNDLLHWQISLIASEHRGGTEPRVAKHTFTANKSNQAAYSAKDPDGHVLIFRYKTNELPSEKQ